MAGCKQSIKLNGSLHGSKENQGWEYSFCANIAAFKEKKKGSMLMFTSFKIMPQLNVVILETDVSFRPYFTC